MLFGACSAAYSILSCMFKVRKVPSANTLCGIISGQGDLRDHYSMLLRVLGVNAVISRLGRCIFN